MKWKTCPKCQTPCDIIPISSLFDIDGAKFGGLFACSKCKTHFIDNFLTPQQIQEIRNTLVVKETVKQQ